MNFTKLLKGAVLCMAFSLAGSVSGQTYTWNGTNGTDWDDAGNWTCSGGGCPTPAKYPGESASTDIAIVAPASNDPLLDLAVTIAELEVQSDGFLSITNGGQLTVSSDVVIQECDDISCDEGGTVQMSHANAQLNLDGKLTIDPGSDEETAGFLQISAGEVNMSNAGPHEVGGFVVLESASSILLVSETMTFGPYDPTGDNVPGFVIGEHNSAELLIVDEKVMTLDGITLSGALTVDAVTGTRPAKLANFGFVVADSTVSGNQTLTLGEDVTLVDCDDPGNCSVFGEWQSVETSAVLQFNRAADGSGVTRPPLNGDFIAANCGMFRFNASVTTLGCASGDGVFDAVGAGVCFEDTCIFDDPPLCNNCADIGTGCSCP